MKICLIHPTSDSRRIIKDHVERVGHTVVREAADFFDLIYHVAKDRPHALFAPQPGGEEIEAFEAMLKNYQLSLPAYWLPSALTADALVSHLDSVLPSLADLSKPAPNVPYVLGTRTILLDRPYADMGSPIKQNVPDPNESSEEYLPGEMAVFARQVERALKHHSAAKRYLNQTLVIDKGLRLELAYRSAHSSFKIYWLREHLVRWVAVLAHYLPGVEPCYLPPPTPPSLKLDFLHYNPPPESYYAITGLLIHGFKPSWMPQLRSALGMKFTGQDEATLLQDTLVLWGWSALLREIVLAHKRVMVYALDSNFPWYAKGMPARAIHRSTQTYCDFWHLRHLRQNPALLRSIADGVVVDGVKMPGTLPVVPPFRHYVETPFSDDRSNKN